MLLSRLNSNHHEDGFTLIEILIVIGIIGVLALISVPFYLGALKKAWITSVTSDVTQTATRFSSFYSTTCSSNPDCAAPSQTDWTNSIKVSSDPQNAITAYLYTPGSITSSSDADATDANDYYANGIVCVQGVVQKITDTTDPSRIWSYYFVLGAGGSLTAVKDTSNSAENSGSLHQGGCDGATVGNPQVGDSSSYLNSNSALVAAYTGNWTVNTVYN